MRAEGKGAAIETAQSHDSRAQGGMGHQRRPEEQPGNGLKVLLMQKVIFARTYTH